MGYKRLGKKEKAIYIILQLIIKFQILHKIQFLIKTKNKIIIFLKLI